MDDDAATDVHEKELSISLAASSMINSSDMISEEAYRANLRRIQEVKEMVQRLEMNNESAHKNFVVNQLEKRAREGREAENMLAQLKNRPRPPETVQFTNNIPSGKSEVILPTTATLVEVPDSHSSYSSPGPIATFPSQTVQEGRPAEYQWNPGTQVHQPYYPDVFRYYAPPSAVRQFPQFSAAPRSQAPASRQGWYTTQNVPPQSGVHNPPAHQPGFQPIQVQQWSQSRNSYPPPVVDLPAVDTVPVTAPGYYTSPSGYNETAPARSGPSTGSSSTTYRAPGFPTQSTESRSSVTSYNQPQDLPSPALTSQMQAPLHGVPVSSGAKVTSSQPPPDRSQPLSTEQVAISRLKRLHHPQQQLRPQSQLQHHEQLPQFSPQLQQLSRPSPQPRPQPQRLLQPSLQPQQPLQFPGLPPQPPLQPPQTHPQAPPQSADRSHSTTVPQPHGQPSQVHDANASPGTPRAQSTQPAIVQEQARLQGAQPSLDRATFVKLFQIALQRGIMHFKAFFHQAKVSGISDEWLRAAIDSLPRDVWQSFVAQANQSELIIDVPSSANVPWQQVSATSGPNAPVVSGRPQPTASLLVQATPTFQQVSKPNIVTEGRITPSASGQTSELYAAQLQYYAEQATKSAFSTQMASISTTASGNITSTQKTDALSIHDVPQAELNVRTPKDANKSTLARDILRSLGKIVPKLSQETRSELTDKANSHEGDQRPEVNAPQPASRVASPKPPVDPQETCFVPANSPYIPSAEPNIQSPAPYVAPSNPSTAQSVLKEEVGQAAVIEGPIMIDLTLEDLDESVDRNEPEPTFPIQTSTSTATSSRPVSPTNTTNHTPLLESLSLEESPIEVAAGGDSADVRMYSPPLSQAAEENMEFELLHLPLGSAEPVPPSFEALTREASEHPAGGQLPLFLPSPPASPAHTELPETDREATNDEGKSRPSLKRRSVDGDEMEVDTAPLIPRIRKRPKQQVYVLIPPAPPYVKRVIKRMRGRAMGRDRGSDLEGAGEDDEIQYSHLEQLLIEESKSRLLERRCLWLNCDVVLNCAANLLAHLKKHASEANLQAPFLCRWTSCRKQFDTEQERDVHLEGHTIRPLPCPFAGCDERFNKPVEVMQHEVEHQKAEHRESLVRKPTYQPVVPAIPARLGPPPHRIPSHWVIPRRVVKCRISADRHAVMGPWILWNIFSPVELNTRKQNASMRARPTRQAVYNDMDSLDPRRDDYDFLLALSPHPAKNPRLDDLDSTLITMSAARGLTLWGFGSAVNSATGAAAPEERTDVVPLSGMEETEGEGKSDSAEEGRVGRSVAIGEEDIVEAYDWGRSP